VATPGAESAVYDWLVLAVSTKPFQVGDQKRNVTSRLVILGMTIKRQSHRHSDVVTLLMTSYILAPGVQTAAPVKKNDITIPTRNACMHSDYRGDALQVDSAVHYCSLFAVDST